MKVLFLFLAFSLGWLIAQTIKLITGLIKQKGKMSFSDVRYYMFKSGGMPSGHTASFVALDTALALMYGIEPVFVVAVCATAIFIYDAVNVRYAVGEHGRLLNEIAESDRNPKTKPQKIVEGHTIPQVIVGAFLGILLGWVTYVIAGAVGILT
ncbi:divergent PAP2 family protein [Candidatus Saccharibacteria bacterium]|nr:divergent PAP2 family protein [Candidatus Saccharibacteria bacterium]MBR0415646.1 divergent PAP2 family protein [Candidatus Saccharibacteria bacterium]